MSGARTSAAMLLAACSGFVLLALTLAYGEVSPYFSSGVSFGRTYVAVISGDYRPGASLWSKDMFLRDCLSGAASIFSKAQLPKRRTAFLEACRDEAKAITSAMPTYSRGFLVAAASEAELKQFDVFGVDLAESIRTARAVHWLAERRSALAERNYEHLDESGRNGLADDILTLLESPTGQRALARRYVSNSDGRDRMTAVIERARPELQSAFFSSVKAALASRAK